MSHVKAWGSTQNTRDSNAKYRGVKIFGGGLAKAGNILIRQCGSKYEAWKNVYLGKDFTIHASIDGVVHFSKKRFTKYDGNTYAKTVIHIIPSA